MSRCLIDAHIHLDMYKDEERTLLLNTLEESSVDALVAVSNNLASSDRQLELAGLDNRINPAIGYHPEQTLPAEEEFLAMLNIIDQNSHRLTAIGEVGLPYYMRQEYPDLEVAPYIEVLEQFIRKAKDYELPIALHAVYEDAALVCDLLEAYSIEKAHFHWFKGEDTILKRILANGYVVSVTPDVTYKAKVQHIVDQTPLSQLMVETDGPWPFEGHFKGELTHPSMMHKSIQTIAEIKHLNVDEVYRKIYATTRDFYRIE